MKKFYLFAATALALSSCTSDEFFGNSESKNESNVIGFSTFQAKTTRADFKGSEAAEKLGGNFVVYGFKSTAAADAADGLGDQKVFDRYNVNYTAGTANTTESNTADWEYVGYANHDGSIDPQTIKYWDYEAVSYVFSAVSGTGITATKTLTGATKYDKGWKVTIPAGGDISTLYASDRKVALKDNGSGSDYQKQVDLTFRALGTKIRFAMYETVPGYEVHIDKFYYNDGSWQNTETNFAIDGTFKTANATTTTPLTITYYDDASGIENRPKVTYEDGDVTSADYAIFGANIQATPAIGTTSAEATYDQSDKSYTMILPYESLATSTENTMELYVDYTLTAPDTDEKIHVKHASAKVPTNFNQWKPNFAYTYIFKISDNTNGTTGTPGTNPDDPNVDPTGLFPITFDAVVVTDETDVQETITSVSDPSITTYQEGVVVTANDEYKAGMIYFENDAKDVSAYKVYEVHNYGDIEKNITEEVVANWEKNFCVLTEVETADAAPGIPLTDGTLLKKTANQARKFLAEAGKTYAITDGAGHWKVVKVTGEEAAFSYTLAADATLTEANATAVLTLKMGAKGVLGAIPCFKVTKSGVASNNLEFAAGTTDGTYIVSIKGSAIADGSALGVYNVDFQGQPVTVSVSYTQSLSTLADVEAGDATGQKTTLAIAGITTPAGAVIVNENKGITITDDGDGKYTVKAASDVATGTYTATIAGIDLTINVKNYIFNVSSVEMTKPYNDNVYANINLWDGSAAPAVAPSAITITSSASGLVIGDADALNPNNGQYTLTGSAGGVYTLTYNKTAAKCVVTVNEYTIATPASIKKSTGIATIEVKCNGTTINAATASLAETAKPTDAVYTVSTNGKTIKFSGASKAGDYKFDYKVGTTIVAQVTVTVTD